MSQHRFLANCLINTHANKNKARIQKILNLLKGQKKSFFYFMKINIIGEIQRCKYWFTFQVQEWIWFPKRLCFEVPIQSYQEINRLDITYIAQIWIQRSKYSQLKQKVITGYLVVIFVPLLTCQGHFLINGNSFVCITTTIRRSSLYKSRKLNLQKRKLMFYIDFVPEQGQWVRLKKDHKKITWFCMLEELRIVIWLYIKCVNLVNMYQSKYVFKNQYFPFFDLNQIAKSFYPSLCKDPNKFQLQKIITISSRCFRFKCKITKFIRKYSNPILYNAGMIGRNQINKHFYQILSASITIIIPLDFIDAINEITQLINKFMRNRFNDIDHLSCQSYLPVEYSFKIDVAFMLTQEILNLKWQNF